MTPNETAQQIVDKFTIVIFESGNTVSKPMIKEVASLACNLLIKHSKDIAEVYDLTFDESTSYYTKVKKAIESM